MTKTGDKRKDKTEIVEKTPLFDRIFKPEVIVLEVLQVVVIIMT